MMDSSSYYFIIQLLKLTNIASLEVATQIQWISRASAYKSEAKLKIIFELAKISHKNLRLLYVLPLN